MTRIAALSMVLVAWLASSPAIAQTVKCIDKTGKTTYTNMKCSDLGLKDAGEVPDHLNTNPAYQPPNPANQPTTIEQLETRQSPPSRPPAAEASKPKPAAAAPPKQDDADPSGKRRCFKTAAGFRCNEGGNEGGTEER